MRYGEHLGDIINPDDYIEKTISLSYDLPRLSPQDVLELVQQYRLPPVVGEQTHLIISGLGVNPRRVKRFLNGLVVMHELADRSHQRGGNVPTCLLPASDPSTYPLFLKLAVVSYRFSGLFARAVIDTELLPRLQRLSNKHDQTAGSDPRARLERTEALANDAMAVRQTGQEDDFWKVMRQPPSFIGRSDQIELLVSWFRSSGALGAPRAATSPGAPSE